MNFLQSIHSLPKELKSKFSNLIQKPIVSLSIALAFGIIPQVANAAPQGEFRITTNNGNRIDVYGDYLPSSKGPVHLWNQDYLSNLFVLGPNEGTGNEIRVKSDQTICLTPDVILGVKPLPGTPIVAKRDCPNSYNFKFEGGKIYMGRYPDMCLDIPNNNDVIRQKLQIHPCNGSPAQQFNTGDGNISTKNNQRTVISEWSDYEYWLVSSPTSSSSGSFGVSSSALSGHTFVALIKKDFKKFSDGEITSIGWKPWQTFGFWNNKTYAPKPGLNESLPIEFDTINEILNGQSNGINAVRKSKISQNRANWIASNPGYTGCDSNKYGFNQFNTDSSYCSCVTFATRHWTYFTANWENFQPYGSLGRSPKDVSLKIQEQNTRTGSQFVDKNTIWE